MGVDCGLSGNGHAKCLCGAWSIHRPCPLTLKTKKAFFSSNALKINQNEKSVHAHCPGLLLHFYERFKTVRVQLILRRSAYHSFFTEVKILSRVDGTWKDATTDAGNCRHHVMDVGFGVWLNILHSTFLLLRRVLSLCECILLPSFLADFRLFWQKVGSISWITSRKDMLKIVSPSSFQSIHCVFGERNKLSPNR